MLGECTYGKFDFQHPDSGCLIIATYENQVLTLELADDTIENACDETIEELSKWCARYSGKHFNTIESASDYLVSCGVHRSNIAW